MSRKRIWSPFGGAHPPRRAGDLCLDRRVTDVQPDVRGTALDLPFRSGSFSEVLFERIPYHVLTERHSVALVGTARALRPGGRLEIT